MTHKTLAMTLLSLCVLVAGCGKPSRSDRQEVQRKKSYYWHVERLSGPGDRVAVVNVSRARKLGLATLSLTFVDGRAASAGIMSAPCSGQTGRIYFFFDTNPNQAPLVETWHSSTPTLVPPSVTSAKPLELIHAMEAHQTMTVIGQCGDTLEFRIGGLRSVLEAAHLQ